MAAALSLGGLFWFDKLNKFIVVRSTIMPQGKGSRRVKVPVYLNLCEYCRNKERSQIYGNTDFTSPQPRS